MLSLLCLNRSGPALVFHGTCCARRGGAGRGQCAVTSERSWVRGDRDTSCCLCKSGARSRSRVFPLPRILSKLPPEPPPLTLRTLGPSPLPQRASGEALPRLSRSRARGACRPRASASARANQTPRFSCDISGYFSVKHASVSFKPSNKRREHSQNRFVSFKAQSAVTTLCYAASKHTS